MRNSKTRRKAKAEGYRSGFESKVAEALTEAGVTYQYETVTIPFTAERKYLPDFCTKAFYIEAKGRFTASDRAKHLAIKEQHPEVEVRFVFQRNNTLSTRTTTRYSDWCAKHGYKWCIGPAIPAEWLAELACSKGKPKVRASAKRRQASSGVSGADNAPAGRRRAQARSRQVRDS